MTVCGIDSDWSYVLNRSKRVPGNIIEWNRLQEQVELNYHLDAFVAGVCLTNSRFGSSLKRSQIGNIVESDGGYDVLTNSGAMLRYNSDLQQIDFIPDIGHVMPDVPTSLALGSIARLAVSGFASGLNKWFLFRNST